MIDSPEPDAKVLFRVPREDGTDAADVETLWAWHLGDDKYKLDNSPYYAYSVSWQDIVHAPYDEDEDFPTYRNVIEKSGNRTIRIIFDPPVASENKSAKFVDALVELGCDYEGGKPKLHCIQHTAILRLR